MPFFQHMLVQVAWPNRGAWQGIYSFKPMGIRATWTPFGGFSNKQGPNIFASCYRREMNDHVTTDVRWMITWHTQTILSRSAGSTLLDRGPSELPFRGRCWFLFSALQQCCCQQRINLTRAVAMHKTNTVTSRDCKKQPGMDDWRHLANTWALSKSCKDVKWSVGTWHGKANLSLFIMQFDSGGAVTDAWYHPVRETNERFLGVIKKYCFLFLVLSYFLL